MVGLAGLFITFEGGEGAGKSTQIRLLAQALQERGQDVLMTREPGGSAGAEAVRHVILSGAAEHFGTRMEALLFAAARSDHVEELIRPALAAGRVVLCDRFVDSALAYQGYGRGLDLAELRQVLDFATGGLLPDLVVLLEGGLDARGRRVGVVISGGNVDLGWAAARLLAQASAR